MRIRLVLAVILSIFLILFIENTKADMLDDYLGETVTYIELDNRILKEYNKYTCKNEILYKKHYGKITDFKGKAVRCKNIEITRKDYEEQSHI